MVSAQDVSFIGIYGNIRCELLRDNSIVGLSLCQVIINGGNMTKYFCDFKGCENEVNDHRKITIVRQNPNRTYFRFHACESCNIHLWKSLTDDLGNYSWIKGDA